MENVRIEVLAYTKLILEVPDFTVTSTNELVRATIPQSYVCPACV